MKLKYWYCLFIIQMICSSVKAQCPMPAAANCDIVPNSVLLLSTPGNADFTFDGFSKYTAGITQSGSTILRLKILPLNASCKWMLRVYIDNNPAAGTAVTDWERNYPTVAGPGAAPTLDLLQLRVYNTCKTPLFNDVYRTFSNINESYLDIINSATLIPAGSCTTNVNGAGSYITNYNEFSFTIDYRIVPNLNHAPGNYQVSLRFCLVEVM